MSSRERSAFSRRTNTSRESPSTHPDQRPSSTTAYTITSEGMGRFASRVTLKKVESRCVVLASPHDERGVGRRGP
jgi:hypothetical protein